MGYAARRDTAAASTAIAQKLLSNPRVSALLTAAVAPFSFEPANAHATAPLKGDKPAVIFLEQLMAKLQERLETDPSLTSANMLKALIDETLEEVLKSDLALRLEGILQPVRAHSMAQLAFLYDLLDADLPLLFGVGPAGTGKTYLAIVGALNQLATGAVKHIVITKPHEMIHGEIMTAEKRAEKQNDDQLQAYFDILTDLVGQHEMQALIERKRLEIVPLGALRGRTLSESFILIDEAHNTDKHWIRLAATRAGAHSRTVITGDPSQVSLPNGDMNGLTHLLKLIEGQNIGRVHQFRPRDVVRNDTVARIEALYMKAGLTDVELALSKP